MVRATLIGVVSDVGRGTTRCHLLRAEERELEDVSTGPAGEVGSTDGVRAPLGRQSGHMVTAKRGRRRTLVIGVAAAVVLLGVGIGATASSGPNADAAIISAADSALGQKAAHATLTGSIQLNGQTAAVTGSGSYDFSDHAAHLVESIAEGGRQENLQLIYTDGTAYEELPQITRLAPGKSWTSIDLSSWQETGGKSGVVQLGGDPLAGLYALTQQGNSVTALGPSTIGGQSVQGYAVLLSPSVEQRELEQSNLPESMKQVTFGAGSETVFLDGSGNLVRLSKTIDLSDGASGTAILQESYDLSDFGTPVSVIPPPASDVLPYAQFIQLSEASRTA